MSDIKDLVKAVNEVIETCRSCGSCDCCPYQNQEDGHCIMHRETKAENVPEKW